MRRPCSLEPQTIGPAVEHPGVVRSTGRAIRARSEFAGFRFPPEVITLAVRWYLRFGLSYRDVEELLAERGVEVDHTTLFRWAVRLTPLFVEAARPCRHRWWSSPRRASTVPLRPAITTTSAEAAKPLPSLLPVGAVGSLTRGDQHGDDAGGALQPGRAGTDGP